MLNSKTSEIQILYNLDIIRLHRTENHPLQDAIG